MEEWRKVVNGYYEVSNLGNVRRSMPGENTFVGRNKKTSLSGNGYLIFGAFAGGVRKNILVHRAVAEAFHGPCPKGYQVNHKDGVKTNNTVENLEYLTISENQIHALRMGLSSLPSNRAKGRKHWTQLHPEKIARGSNNGAVKHPDKVVRGSRCHASKLNEEKVLAIKHLISAGTLSFSAIARAFGVTHNNIIHINRGKSWAHVKL